MHARLCRLKDYNFLQAQWMVATNIFPIFRHICVCTALNDGNDGWIIAERKSRNQKPVYKYIVWTWNSRIRLLHNDIFVYVQFVLGKIIPPQRKCQVYPYRFNAGAE